MIEVNNPIQVDLDFHLRLNVPGKYCVISDLYLKNMCYYSHQRKKFIKTQNVYQRQRGTFDLQTLFPSLLTASVFFKE